MNQARKCPNCGYVSAEDFCPNCDRYNEESTGVKGNQQLDEQASHFVKDNHERPAIEVKRKSQEELFKEVMNDQPITKDIPKESPQKTQGPVEKTLEDGNASQKSTVETKDAPTKMDSPVADSSANQTTNKKSKKPIIALIVLFLIGVGAFGYYRYQEHQKELARIAEVKKAAKTLDREVAELYLDKEHVFLSPTFTAEKLASVSQKVADFKEPKYLKTAKKNLAILNKKATEQTKINELFVQPVITGATFKEQPLKETAKVDMDPIAPATDSFDELLNQGREAAQKQTKNLQTATQQLAVVFGPAVKETATRSQYNAAKVAIEQIKNSKQKEKYLQQLSKVDEYLVVKEAEAQKIAAAEAARVNANATKPTNLPTAADETGVWAWNPGIKEKVIGECLRRGYIVNGGYELRKKEVRNGEGFYDLYATNTQSSLLRNRQAKELPIYLVTINCKTGWFKGNGPKGT